MTPSTTEAVAYVHRCGACQGKIRAEWGWCPWCGERAEWDLQEVTEKNGKDA